MNACAISALQFPRQLRIFEFHLSWRGAGAVELATLERWYTGNGIVGSNPTLSAVRACEACPN
jgi:hypothetical protein